MRPWQEYILNNQSIYADFIDWAKGAEDSLSATSAKHLLSNDIDKARQCAYEANVYKELRQFIEKEMRERRSQSQYEEGRQ